jgi:two-component system, NtrC family, sensor histidine kinase AtoS
MSNISPYLSNPRSAIVNQIGQDEVGALFDQITEAGLLIDKKTAVVIKANDAFYKLTDFSAKSLADCQISGEPCQAVAFLAVGEDHEITLSRRLRGPIPVIARIISLTPNSNIILAKFIPIEEYVENDAEMWENKIQGAIQLANISESENPEKFARQIFDVIELIFNADMACIYIAESETPELKKLASYGEDNTAFFPDILPPKDFICLSKTKVWHPEMRVSVDLHRQARKDNMRYLASLPLGRDNSSIGMLIIGDYKKSASLFISKSLEIFAAHVSTLFSRHVLLGHLRQETEKLQDRVEIRNSVFENTLEGVLVVDLQNNVIEINPAAENMLGYSSGEVRGEAVENVLIGADLLTEALSSAAQGIATHNMGDVALHQRDGQSFPAHLQIIPVVQIKNVRGIIVFVADVSERENSLLRTRQLEHRALLGEFTSVFAHEVRNPINNISTGVHLLEGKLDPDDPNQEVLTRLQGDCVRLNHLMDSVLSFSRPMDMTRVKTVNLVSLLRRILDRWQPRLERVNITLFFQAAEGTPCVSGISKDLERVFVNLISNAVDAMEDIGGSLAIRINFENVVASKPQVEVTVSDNGPGIPDEVRDRIFEPFVTTRSQGTGLGLAITKQIVTAHRGSISANSFPGGTVFHVYFPAVDGESE